MKCPHCKILLVKGIEADDVIRCNKCGQVFCEFCGTKHILTKHDGFFSPGKLDDHGKFMAARYIPLED